MIRALLFDHHIPPKLEEVKLYFSRLGIVDQEAEDFFYVYECRQWRNKKGKLIHNWKTIAYRWIVSVWKFNALLNSKHAA